MREAIRRYLANPRQGPLSINKVQAKRNAARLKKPKLPTLPKNFRKPHVCSIFPGARPETLDEAQWREMVAIESMYGPGPIRAPALLRWSNHFGQETQWE